MSKRKSQTAVADYIAAGLHPRGARQLPRAARLVDRDRGGGARRSTRSSSASSSTTSTRAAPCSTASGSSGSTASGSAGSTPTTSSTGCGRSSRRTLAAGRIDRMPSRRRAPRAAADRPGAAADARRDRRPGRLPVGRRRRARPGAARPEALGRRRRRARALAAARERHRRGRRRVASRPTSSSRRSGRWPRRVAGRPATCSWRSASRSPAGRRRRRCSTRWSRSAASGRSSASTGRSTSSPRRNGGYAVTAALTTHRSEEPVPGRTARPLHRGVESYDAAAIGELFAEEPSTAITPGTSRSAAERRSSTSCAGDEKQRTHPDRGRPSTSLGRRRRPGGGDRREPLHEPGWLVQGPLLQPLALRFDGHGRCVEFVEYFMQLPERLHKSQ